MEAYSPVSISPVEPYRTPLRDTTNQYLQNSNKKLEVITSPKCHNTNIRETEGVVDFTSSQHSTPKKAEDSDTESDTTADYESAGEASPAGKQQNVSALADRLAGVHLSTPSDKVHVKLNYFPFSPISAEDESEEEISVVGPNKSQKLFSGSLSLMEEEILQKDNSFKDTVNTSVENKLSEGKISDILKVAKESHCDDPPETLAAEEFCLEETNEERNTLDLSPSKEFQDAGPACSFHSEVMISIENQLKSGTPNSSLISNNSLIIEECRNSDSSISSPGSHGKEIFLNYSLSIKEDIITQDFVSLNNERLCSSEALDQSSPKQQYTIVNADVNQKIDALKNLEVISTCNTLEGTHEAKEKLKDTVSSTFLNNRTQTIFSESIEYNTDTSEVLLNKGASLKDVNEMCPNSSITSIVNSAQPHNNIGEEESADLLAKKDSLHNEKSQHEFETCDAFGPPASVLSLNKEPEGNLLFKNNIVAVLEDTTNVSCVDGEYTGITYLTPTSLCSEKKETESHKLLEHNLIPTSEEKPAPSFDDFEGTGIINLKPSSQSSVSEEPKLKYTTLETCLVSASKETDALSSLSSEGTEITNLVPASLISKNKETDVEHKPEASFLQVSVKKPIPFSLGSEDTEINLEPASQVIKTKELEVAHKLSEGNFVQVSEERPRPSDSNEYAETDDLAPKSQIIETKELEVDYKLSKANLVQVSEEKPTPSDSSEDAETDLAPTSQLIETKQLEVDYKLSEANLVQVTEEKPTPSNSSEDAETDLAPTSQFIETKELEVDYNLSEANLVQLSEEKPTPSDSSEDAETDLAPTSQLIETKELEVDYKLSKANLVQVTEEKPTPSDSSEDAETDLAPTSQFIETKELEVDYNLSEANLVQVSEEKPTPSDSSEDAETDLAPTSQLIETKELEVDYKLSKANLVQVTEEKPTPSDSSEDAETYLAPTSQFIETKELEVDYKLSKANLIQVSEEKPTPSDSSEDAETDLAPTSQFIETKELEVDYKLSKANLVQVTEEKPTPSDSSEDAETDLAPTSQLIETKELEVGYKLSEANQVQVSEEKPIRSSLGSASAETNLEPTLQLIDTKDLEVDFKLSEANLVHVSEEKPIRTSLGNERTKTNLEPTSQLIDKKELEVDYKVSETNCVQVSEEKPIRTSLGSESTKTDLEPISQIIDSKELEVDFKLSEANLVHVSEEKPIRTSFGSERTKTNLEPTSQLIDKKELEVDYKVSETNCVQVSEEKPIRTSLGSESTKTDLEPISQIIDSKELEVDFKLSEANLVQVSEEKPIRTSLGNERTKTNLESTSQLIDTKELEVDFKLSKVNLVEVSEEKPIHSSLCCEHAETNLEPSSQLIDAKEHEVDYKLSEANLIQVSEENPTPSDGSEDAEADPEPLSQLIETKELEVDYKLSEANQVQVSEEKPVRSSLSSESAETNLEPTSQLIDTKDHEVDYKLSDANLLQVSEEKPTPSDGSEDAKTELEPECQLIKTKELEVDYKLSEANLVQVSEEKPTDRSRSEESEEEHAMLETGFVHASKELFGLSSFDYGHAEITNLGPASLLCENKEHGEGYKLSEANVDPVLEEKPALFRVVCGGIEITNLKSSSQFSENGAPEVKESECPLRSAEEKPVPFKVGKEGIDINNLESTSQFNVNKDLKESSAVYEDNISIEKIVPSSVGSEITNLERASLHWENKPELEYALLETSLFSASKEQAALSNGHCEEKSILTTCQGDKNFMSSTINLIPHNNDNVLFENNESVNSQPNKLCESIDKKIDSSLNVQYSGNNNKSCMSETHPLLQGSEAVVDSNVEKESEYITTKPSTMQLETNGNKSNGRVSLCSTVLSTKMFVSECQKLSNISPEKFQNYDNDFQKLSAPGCSVIAQDNIPSSRNLSNVIGQNLVINSCSSSVISTPSTSNSSDITGNHHFMERVTGNKLNPSNDSQVVVLKPESSTTSTLTSLNEITPQNAIAEPQELSTEAAHFIPPKMNLTVGNQKNKNSAMETVNSLPRDISNQDSSNINTKSIMKDYCFIDQSNNMNFGIEKSQENILIPNNIAIPLQQTIDEPIINSKQTITPSSLVLNKSINSKELNEYSIHPKSSYAKEFTLDNGKVNIDNDSNNMSRSTSLPQEENINTASNLVKDLYHTMPAKECSTEIKLQEKLDSTYGKNVNSISTSIENHEVSLLSQIKTDITLVGIETTHKYSKDHSGTVILNLRNVSSVSSISSSVSEINCNERQNFDISVAQNKSTILEKTGNLQSVVNICKNVIHSQDSSDSLLNNEFSNTVKGMANLKIDCHKESCDDNEGPGTATMDIGPEKLESEHYLNSSKNNNKNDALITSAELHGIDNHHRFPETDEKMIKYEKKGNDMPSVSSKNVSSVSINSLEKNTTPTSNETEIGGKIFPNLNSPLIKMDGGTILETTSSQTSKYIKGGMAANEESHLLNLNQTRDLSKSAFSNNEDESKQNKTFDIDKDKLPISKIERKSYEDLLDKCSKQERLLCFDEGIKEEATNFKDHMNSPASEIPSLPEGCSLPSLKDSRSDVGLTTAEEDVNKEDIFQDASNFDFEYLSKIRGKPGRSRLIRESLFLKFDPLAASSTPEHDPDMEQRQIQTPQPDSSCDAMVTPPRPPINEEQLVCITPVVPTSLSPSSTNTPKSKSHRARTRPSSGSTTPTFHQEILSKEISRLQELMIKQEFSYQEQITAYLDEIDELKHKITELECKQPSKEIEDKLAAAEIEIEELKVQLAKLEDDKKELVLIGEEYDTIIRRVVQQKEQDIKNLEAEKEQVAVEKEEAVQHLRNMEIAFNDVHQKYEKCKEIIELFKQNEIQYKNALNANEKTIAQQKECYQKLKEHASHKLEAANNEIAEMKKTHQVEIAKLGAINRKMEMQVKSLEETLEQKKKENMELTKICDELLTSLGHK